MMLMRAVCVPALALIASSANAAVEPGVVDGALVFPEGAEIPRSMTATEARWIQSHPLVATRAATPPPSGPVRCASEYEPMAGILLAWEGGNSYEHHSADGSCHHDDG